MALLLAVAAIFAAILATRASFLTGEASGSWQRALRDEVKRLAATIEDVRYTYSVEGSIAFFIAVAQVREQEFRAEAERRTGEQREALLYEAGVQQALLEALIPASEVAADQRYALPGGGFDLIARLADQRQLNADLLAIDPDAEQAVGDRASSRPADGGGGRAGRPELSPRAASGAHAQLAPCSA